MENILWNLFKNTGDIKYFNLLGNVERSNRYGTSKNRRNHTR